MDLMAIILAEGDGNGGGGGQFILLLVMAALIGMGWLKNYFKQKQEQEAKQRRPASGAPDDRPQARPQSGQQGRPTDVREAIARAAMRSMGIEVDEPQRAAPAPPPPDKPTPAPPRRARASQVSQPLGPALEPHHSTLEPTVDDHVDEHIVAGHEKSTPARVAAVGFKADLSSRSKLRQAIVLHEIIGPPKSLRNEQELWDQA